MPALVKGQRIVDDAWQLVETIADYVPENAIVPFDKLADTGASAAWVEGDLEIDEAGAELASLDLVAVHFAAFADGRGLSLATLLRNRFDFQGELRAIGAVQPDLTPFMQRCGFDAFVLDDEHSAQTAINCMASMSDFYQGSVVEPKPPYLRNRTS